MSNHAEKESEGLRKGVEMESETWFYGLLLVVRVNETKIRFLGFIFTSFLSPFRAP